MLFSDVSGYRLKSLREPQKKMSKSEPDTKSRILLTDTPEQITLKFRKAVTDFTPEASLALIMSYKVVKYLYVFVQQVSLEYK